MAVITQIFTLLIGVAMVTCHHLPHPPQFQHPGIPGPPPYRNIFTDFVQNIADGFLGGFLGHGNGIRPGGFNFQRPNTRPGYGEEYYGNGVNNGGVNIPGQYFGMNDHRGPQQDGFHGEDNRLNTGIGQGGNNVAPVNGDSNRPQKPDINDQKDKGDGPVNNYFIVVPLNPNGIKPQTQDESNSNINGASVNDVPNTTEGENVNGDANGNAVVDTQVPNPQNNPEQQKDANQQLMSDPDLKFNPQEPKVSNQIEGSENNQEYITDDSIGNEKLVPGLNDEDIKKGTLMVDQELKYNTNKPEETKITSPDKVDTMGNNDPGFNDDDIKKGISMTDPELIRSGTDDIEKFRNPDAIVFPNEGSQIIIENLPNRFSNAENSNKPSNNVQITQTTPASNNPVIQNQNQNQQVPINNGNGAPYVNGVSNSNGAYTVVNTPSSTESTGSTNGNTGVTSAGQSNGPYVNVEGNPNGEYTIVNVPNNNAGNSQQSYVIPGNGNSGANNPPLVYVLSNGNSGINNPGQGYVTSNYGANYPSQSYGYNNGANKPAQVYIPYSVNSGGNPNQIYVLGNPGAYNLGQNGQSTSGAFTPRPIYVTIPNSGAQTTNGGYYKPIFIPANNGQINVPVTYKPVVSVPTGQGYQVVGNKPPSVMVSYQTPGNVMTSGGNTPPQNVPLLISYKDDESDEEGKKKDGGKRKVNHSVEGHYMDDIHYDVDGSFQNTDETIER